MWCVKFTFETILTEISQNLRFPHFPLFQIFAQLHITGTQALRSGKVLIRCKKLSDKVATIAIHSKAAQCVFTLNQPEENCGGKN